MPSSTRQKRPELDRFGPVRKFGGAGPSRDGAVRPDKGSSVDPAGLGTVSRAVELGYQVIEEYMRQGQSFARAAAGQRGSEEPPSPDPRKLTERMFQYASDLASVWLEYAQVAAGQATAASTASGGAAGRAPVAPHVGGFDIGSESVPRRPSVQSASPSGPMDSASLGGPCVSVDIVSKRRTEVTVELKPGACGAVLVAYDLRSHEPHLPHITGVTIEPKPAENRVVVRLHVPDDRPAGTYAGVIVDKVSNLPQGTLAVRIFE